MLNFAVISVCKYFYHKQCRSTLQNYVCELCVGRAWHTIKGRWIYCVHTIFHFSADLWNSVSFVVQI